MRKNVYNSMCYVILPFYGFGKAYRKNHRNKIQSRG